MALYKRGCETYTTAGLLFEGANERLMHVHLGNASVYLSLVVMCGCWPNDSMQVVLGDVSTVEQRKARPNSYQTVDVFGDSNGMIVMHMHHSSKGSLHLTAHLL